MANVVITSTANSISLDYKDLSNKAGVTRTTFRKEEVLRIDNNSSTVSMFLKDGRNLILNYDKGDDFVIATIDGVAPASLSDLYTKLIALIA